MNASVAERLKGLLEGYVSALARPHLKRRTHRSLLARYSEAIMVLLRPENVSAEEIITLRSRLLRVLAEGTTDFAPLFDCRDMGSMLDAVDARDQVITDLLDETVRYETGRDDGRREVLAKLFDAIQKYPSHNRPYISNFVHAFIGEQANLISKPKSPYADLLGCAVRLHRALAEASEKIDLAMPVINCLVDSFPLAHPREVYEARDQLRKAQTIVDEALGQAIPF